MCLMFIFTPSACFLGHLTDLAITRAERAAFASEGTGVDALSDHTCVGFIAWLDAQRSHRYGVISYRLLNGFSNGTRRTPLKPASIHISRTFDSWKPNVPSPTPPAPRDVVMQ